MTDINKKKQAILLFILIITLATAFVFLQFLKSSDKVASPSTPPATSTLLPDNTVAANAQETTSTSTRPTVTQQKHKPKVPKGLVILLKEGASIQPDGPLAKYLAMPEVSHKRLHNLNMISITIPDNWDLNKIQKDLKQDEAVLDWLQNEPMVTYGVIPNDPLFNNASFRGLDWALGDAPGISARSAWHYTTGDETVIIAVLDTGVDYTHPDLKDNIWINQAELNGQALVDDDHPDGPIPCIPSDLYCDDIRGTANLGGNLNTNTQDVGSFSHGTAVSSIIAGRGDNQEYYAGVSWRAKILSVTAFNRGGVSDRLGFFAGAEYILEMKLNRNVNIRAINYSGGSGNSPRAVRFGEILAKILEAANILLVSSSGNSKRLINDQSNDFLANVESPIHITVGATNRRGKSASFSSLGPQVEIVAPGEAVPGFLSGLAYAFRNIDPILLANFPKDISDPNAFEKWLVAPKDGWRITNNGQLVRRYSGRQTEVLSLSPRYGSVGFETSLSSPEPLTLHPDFNPEDVQIAVFLAYSLREGAALTLEIAATTQTRSWAAVQTWTGSAPFGRHELSLPQGFDERSFFIRFRTTPSVRGDDFAVVEYLSVVHIPPIPNYANRRGTSATDYVPSINGTSFSAPHVAGVAALAWAQRPDLSAVEMKKVILDPQNIDPFSCTIQGQACTSSGGSLNAFKVLSAITTPAVGLSGANDIMTTPGQSYHFPVRLHRAPGVFTSIDQVIFRVELTHRDTASEQTTFQTDTLSFTADNWYQASSITLTTEANGQALFVPDSDGFIITSMRLIASDTTKSDTDFAGVSTEKTVCFQKPNGQAQVLGLCNFIAQEGGSLTYHLRLSSTPDDTFTITVVLASDSSASASKTQFTFTSANWNERQILTIHFNDVDLNSNAPNILPIRFVLTDTALSTSQTLNANINLLDSGQVPSIVPSVNHLELIGHSSQTVTIKLGGQPSTIVQLDMDNSHPGLFDVYPKTLVFTPDNWDDAQIITLKATSVGQTNATLMTEVNNAISDTQYHNTSIDISILFDAR
ncbi:MAG: S8 family serine peptidase, partial [Candidatus Oxydemutatoraceae bacterium WSBS_2016_MAG_OTU14]